MDLDDSLSLSPNEQLRVDQTMERFWNLLNSERSRYETQARELIENQTLVTETDDFMLKYSIRGDLYVSRGIPKQKDSDSFCIEFPIPDTKQERIESLVELFAQSEAG
jgi:hypothetical protein